MRLSKSSTQPSSATSKSNNDGVHLIYNNVRKHELAGVFRLQGGTFSPDKGDHRGTGADAGAEEERLFVLVRGQERGQHCHCGADFQDGWDLRDEVG